MAGLVTATNVGAGTAVFRTTTPSVAAAVGFATAVGGKVGAFGDAVAFGDGFPVADGFAVAAGVGDVLALELGVGAGLVLGDGDGDGLACETNVASATGPRVGCATGVTTAKPCEGTA